METLAIPTCAPARVQPASLFRCRPTPAFRSPYAAAAAWTRRYRLRRLSSCSIPSIRCSAVPPPSVSATGTDAVVIPCGSISSSILYANNARHVFAFSSSWQ